MADVKMNLETEPVLQIKVYPIDPLQKEAFLEFCDYTILWWLKELPGVNHCSAWTVQNGDGLWLLVAVTPHDDHPWEGIPGLSGFLKETPVIDEVPGLKF
jgi:hypothetical protein